MNTRRLGAELARYLMRMSISSDLIYYKTTLHNNYATHDIQSYSARYGLGMRYRSANSELRA